MSLYSGLLLYSLRMFSVRNVYLSLDNTSSGTSPSTVGVVGGVAGGLLILTVAVIAFVLLFVYWRKSVSGMYEHACVLVHMDLDMMHITVYQLLSFILYPPHYY